MDSFINPDKDDFTDTDNFDVDLSILDDGCPDDDFVDPSQIDDLLDDSTPVNTSTPNNLVDNDNMCNFVNKYRKLKERYDSLKSRYKKLKQKSIDMQSENKFLYEELSSRDAQIDEYKRKSQVSPRRTSTQSHPMTSQDIPTNLPSYQNQFIPQPSDSQSKRTSTHSHPMTSQDFPINLPSYQNQFIPQPSDSQSNWNYTRNQYRSYSTPTIPQYIPQNHGVYRNPQSQANLDPNFLRNMFNNMTLPELPLNSGLQQTNHKSQ